MLRYCGRFTSYCCSGCGGGGASGAGPCGFGIGIGGAVGEPNEDKIAFYRHLRLSPTL